jgi:hypothetical protein
LNRRQTDVHSLAPFRLAFASFIFGAIRTSVEVFGEGLF